MKPTLILAPIFALLASFFSTGCATIIQPGPDRVMVNSTPSGVRVFLDEQPVGQTPVQVSFRREGEGVLRFEKDGYQTLVVDRDKVVAGWTFLNAFFWPGLIVDLITHSQGKYSDDPIFVSLAPNSSK